MTKSKNTKRALLMSALSMMLCIAMLAGSTFAWFTDTVTSGKNRIVAGNLDVELYYKNAFTEKGVTVEADKWANASEASVANPNFFVDKDGEKIKWEPGVMAVTQFKVANVGTLALKYALKTLKEDFNSLREVVKDENGNETEPKYHDLSEVIKFAVIGNDKYTEGTTTREDILALENLKFTDFTGFTATGDLFPVGKEADGPSEEIFTVVAYWAPNANEVDNLYNANNSKVIYKDNGEPDNGAKELYINIEISLVATQYTYEKDSFGDDYDQNADVYGLIGSEDRVEALVSAGYTEAKSPEALSEALNSPDVDKIVVSKDISVSDPVTPVSNLTIDLNGNNFESAGRALQVTSGKEVVVKNGTLSSKEIAAFCSGDLTLDNVKIEGSEKYAAVYANNGNVNISGGSISAKGSAKAVWANSGSNVVNIKGTVITSETNTVVAFESSKINLENCEISTTSAAAFPVATNGSTSKDVELSIKNTKINRSVGDGWAAYFPAGTVELLDCTVDGAVVIAGGDVTIDGGTYTAEGSPNEAPYVWDDEATWRYCQEFKKGDGAGHMGDSILIVDRRTNGYELKSVTIKNATFNTRFTDEKGNEQTAYAIKYVDLNNSNVAKVTPVFENNTYNHKLADGTDPVMSLSK